MTILSEKIQFKRNCYSLTDLKYIFDWTKPTAIIGDGESKCRYLYDRRHINVFGINRAVKVYPADMMICGAGHVKFLHRVLPHYIPFGVITKNDGKKFNLINGANAVVFLSYVIEITQNPLVILQGFDFTRSDQGADYNWKKQANGFWLCNRKALKRNLRIIMTHYNGLLGFFQISKPDDKLIL